MQSRGPLALVIFCVAVAAATPVDWDHYLLTKLPRSEVPCPSDALRVVVFGQSQAANNGERRRTGPASSFSSFNGRCYPLRDPVPGASEQGGSIWPMFAQDLGRPVVIIDGAVNGASIQQLSGAPLARLKANIGTATPDLVIFMQGESDNARHTDAPSYLRSLRFIRSRLPGRWLVVRESVGANQAPSSDLNHARFEIAASDKSVMVGPDLDLLGPEYRQSDHVHFNRKGQDAVAALLAASVRWR